MSTEFMYSYWQKVFDDLKFWYDKADGKSTGIISVNGMLLGFMTISAFVTTSNTDIRADPELVFLLISFFISVIISISLAISVLWARIKFVVDQQTTRDTPLTFFSYIAHEYPSNEKSKDSQGKLFFDKEIKNYPTQEKLLGALAIEIVLLSSNVNKKYVRTNVSYICVLVSIGLMATFTLVRFLQ